MDFIFLTIIPHPLIGDGMHHNNTRMKFSLRYTTPKMKEAFHCYFIGSLWGASSYFCWSLKESYVGSPLLYFSRSVMHTLVCWRYYTPRTFITSTCRHLVRAFIGMQDFNIGIFTKLKHLIVHAFMGLHERSFLHDFLLDFRVLSLRNWLVLSRT